VHLTIALKWTANSAVPFSKFQVELKEFRKFYGASGFFAAHYA